ncbi:unnamed protein product [Parajaminaea phylloscopi]
MAYMPGVPVSQGPMDCYNDYLQPAGVQGGMMPPQHQSIMAPEAGRGEHLHDPHQHYHALSEHPSRGYTEENHALQQQQHQHQQQQMAAAEAAAAYWQLPPAPRMSALAARGWNADFGAHPASYARYPPASMHPYPAPWGPSSFYTQPRAGPAHYQDHQEIESQILLQHQIQKLHGANGGYHPPALPPHRPEAQHLQEPNMQPPPSYSQPEGSQSYHAHARQSLEQPVQWLEQPFDVGPSRTYQDARGHGFEHGAFQGLPFAAQPLSQSQSQQGTRLHSQNAQRGQEWARAMNPHSHSQTRRHRHSHSDWHAMHPHHSQPARSQMTRQDDTLDGHGHGHGPGAQYHSSWNAIHEEPFSARQSRLRHGSAGSIPHHTAVESTAEARLPPVTTEAPMPQEEQRQDVQAQSSKQSGPAPPSPDTLDKSGVPLSSFGAEMIWYACAPLLDPELIALAKIEDDASVVADAHSPSSASTISSPSLSTPQTTPHSPELASSKDADMASAMLSSSGLGERLLQMGHTQSRQHTSSLRRNIVRTDDPRSSDSSSLNSSGPGTPSPVLRAAPCLGLHGGDVQIHKDMDDHRMTSPSSRGPSLRVRSLMRTKSNERSRYSALSVLGLVSSRWRWSNTGDGLPSLEQAAATATARAAEARQRKSQSPSSPKEGQSSGAAFVPAGEVSPAFRRFAHQVLAQTLLSPTAFLLALLYSLRVPYFAVDEDGNVDPEAIEVFATPPSAAPFKLFTLGLMIANKHLDDNTFLNKTWNEVTGIPLPELNRIEQYFLTKCNYEVAVPHSVWVTFLHRVRSREEGRIVYGSYQLSRQRCHRTGAKEFRPARGSSSSGSSETSRRVLLAVEDMLLAVGSSGIVDPFDLSESHHDRARGGSRSPDRQRPSATLLSQHKHCRSAPGKIMDIDASAGAIRDALPSRPVFDATTRAMSDQPISGVPHPRYCLPGLDSHNVPLAPSALLKLLNSGRSLAECQHEGT